MMRAVIENMLGLSALDRIEARAAKRVAPDRSIYQVLCEDLGLEVAVDRADLAKVPTDRPLIVVANHPTGALDGTLLSALLERAGATVRSLGHVWFRRWPAIAERMFLVDPQRRDDSGRQRNREALTQATKWLRDGNTLVVFPAGVVAGWSWSERRVVEGDWQGGVPLLARRARATVLPVHIEARASLGYRLVSMVHGRLAACLLARELLAKLGSRTRIRIGEPVAPNELLNLGASTESMADELMRRTLALGSDGASAATTPCDTLPPSPKSGARSGSEPVRDSHPAGDSLLDAVSPCVLFE